MKTKIYVQLLTCTAAVALVTASHANSQDNASTDDTTVLERIIVKRGRLPERKGTAADTPLATSTDNKTISEKDIQDLDDLGNSTEPGVSYVASSKSVNIRGLEADRVLTTIDGITIPYLDDKVWGADGGVNSYDFTSLATVSILRGADSSRAGSGALGGAVVLRTLEPEDLIKEGSDWGGFAKTIYDSSDRSIIGSLGAAKKIENTSILFQGSYKKGHETKTAGSSDVTGTSRTEADPSDYTNTNLLFKLRQELEGGHQIGLTAERFSSEKDTDAKSSYTTNYTSYDTIADTTRSRVSLDYKYDPIANDSTISQAWASIYYQKIKRSEGYSAYRSTTAPIGDYSRISDTDEDSYGVVGAISGRFDTGALHHEVTVGGNVELFSTSQYINGTDNCATSYSFYTCSFSHINQADTPDVDGTKVGIYIDDRIELGNSGFSLTPGVRFDYFKYDPQASSAYEANSGYTGVPDGVSDSAFSPKLRAEYALKPDVTLYAQWAMAFKAPTSGQLYSNYDNAPYYRQVGNPDLESETSQGFEIGAEFGDEDFGGRLSGFYNRYKNFIDSQTVAETGYSIGTYRYYNVDRVRIYGAEARLNKSFDNGFNLRTSIAYAKGEDLETGNALASVAPLKAIIGGGYAAETWGVNLDWIGVKAVSENSTASFKAPGYGIFNLTGYWAPETAKGLRFQAGIYNLFDKEYYDALETKDVTSITSANKAFYSETGRYFKVSVTKTF